MKKIIQKSVCFIAVLLLAAGGVFLFLSEKAFGENFYADSDVPLILPRSAWDSTPTLNALMTWVPDKNASPSDYQPVERIIIHDTGCDAANPVCNNNQNPVATIQAMYRYHAVTRGWGDIGYNYIIDQQGRIYEGRSGGNGSRGAHVYVDKTKDNFNFGTIGIAVIGNYATVKAPEAVYQSLARLVGWLAAANNLDPQGARSSSIWNLLTSEFSSLYNGPVVVGHKDVEKGNPDPATFDFSRIRREAAVFAAGYRNYVYQANGLPKIYKIFSGTRQAYDDLSTYVGAGGAYQKVAALAQSQLDLFSESRFLKYPDGSLLRIGGQAAVYLVEEGRKRILSVSAKEFTALGFDFDRVRGVETAADLAAYPDGDVIKYGPDKQLLSDGRRVFLIQNGKKRWIPSGALFTALGYSWSKVKTAATDLKTYLDGAVLTYPDGTLLQGAGQEAVYLISGGKLRRFISAEVFLKLKYSWSKIKKIPTEELAYYPMGDYVKYKDGTLLRPKDENNVYLVAGGKAQVVDAATFKKKKYRWADVLVIAAQDFHVLYKGAALFPSPAGSGPTASQPSASPAGSGPTASQPSASPAGSGPTASQPSASATVSGSPASSPSTSQSSASPAVTPLTGVASPSTSSGQAKMRVAIYEVTSPSVTLTASTAFNVLDKAGQVVAAKNANENYVYNISTTSTAFAKIAPQAAEGIVTIVSYADHPAWKPSLNYNQFHGSVEIVYSAKSNKVWAVNELELEDYLRGIAEISATDAAEYQKAMVVAARTYAYYYIQKGGKRGADEVYILNNTTSDQLYKGYGREILAPSIVQAVKDTRGEIVAYGGNPIISAYSSGAPELQTSGTKSACSVWGTKFCAAEYAYLNGGIKDPAGAIYDYPSCAGASHCVGLSGAGARAFAKAGTKNYQEILKYYYTGTEIKKIY